MTVKTFETDVNFTMTQKSEADKDFLDGVPAELRQYLNRSV